MKYYASCPVCAHKLMKGENGTQADIRCARCKNLVRIRIVDDIVTVNLIEKNQYNNRKQGKALPRIGRCFLYIENPAIVAGFKEGNAYDS